jgi:hypothetical protein
MRDHTTSIMINMPRAYFLDGGYPDLKERAFRQFYQRMGHDGHESDCFHHWISRVPVMAPHILDVFVCFHGLVQYRARVVEFRRHHTETFIVWDDELKCNMSIMDGPRNWMLTTGPVITAPPGMHQQGFRGFRYCSKLF